MSTYKIFHDGDKVKVIDSALIPERPQRCSQNAAECGLTDFEELGEEWHCKCDQSEERYTEALSTALRTKAVEVTNAFITFPKNIAVAFVGDRGHTVIIERPFENTLYDLPKAFGLEIIETLPPKARIVVREEVEAQPQQETQDELWDEAEHTIEQELKEVRGYGPVTAQSITYFLRKVLKSKYKITRL